MIALGHPAPCELNSPGLGYAYVRHPTGVEEGPLHFLYVDGVAATISDRIGVDRGK
jgi:hypothetical protein